MISKSILVIDSFNVFMRHFCVNETITAGGDLVGGVVGFVKALGTYINQLKPDSVYVVWEQGGPSQRRKHIYPAYKANRATNKALQDVYRNDGKYIASSDGKNKLFQLQLLTKILGHLPVCQVYVPDTECDDVIGYLVKRKFQTNDQTKIIVSSDKDFYQLLEDKNVRIFDPGRKILIDSKYVLDNFAISAKNFTLARSIVGDTSDNLEGVQGIGLKTIANRFPDFKREDIDLNLEWIKNQATKMLSENKKAPKCLSDIISHMDIIERNWRLMFLDTSCLASTQIAKVDYQLEIFNPKCNKLDYIKTFVGADIPLSEDIDRAFLYAKTLLR